jgi:putative transposase
MTDFGLAERDQAMSDSSKPATERSSEDRQLAEELVERARSEGVDLVGPDGLLSGLTKNVLEAGLEAEMSEHLAYYRHDPAGKYTGNSRNDTRSKKVLTDVGPVEIEVLVTATVLSNRSWSRSASVGCLGWMRW